SGAGPVPALQSSRRVRRSEPASFQARGRLRPSAPPQSREERPIASTKRDRTPHNAAMQDLTERYVELGLRLGKHADELVDSFYDPAELEQRVEAEELRDPSALAEDAAALLEDVGEQWLE